MQIIPDAAPGANFERAADFLSTLARGGRLAVASIVPDGPVAGAVFNTNEQRTALTEWLQARNGTANLYYSLNEPTAAATERLKEADVAALRGVAVDLDPRAAEEAQPGGFERERARLLATAAEWSDHFFAPPTAIVDSGSGIQMLWLFPDPLPNTDDNRAAVKAQAKALGAALGSDAVQSVDHLFRIPFTENLPNEKKRARGRAKRAAQLLRHNALTTSLSSLAVVAPPEREAPAAAVPVLAGFDYAAVISAAEDPSSLPASLAAQVERLRQTPAATTALSNASDRSGRDFALACLAIERGTVGPTEVAQVTFALAPEKLLEKDGTGYGESYAASTVRRALERTKPAPTAGDWFAASPANLPVPLPTFRVVRGLVDPKKIPVRDWLVKPRLPVGDVFQLVGEPGISKSTFMIRDALAVVTGREDILRGVDGFGNPITSERLHRSGPVVIYNAEDREEEMARRLAASQRHFGVTDSQMKHDLLLWSGVDGVPLKVMERTNDRGPLRPAKGLAMLEAMVSEYNAVLVILDPQVSLASGAVENSNEDADAIMGELARLASRTGVCIAVVHHTAKATRAAAGDMGAGRGAFAAVGKVRSAHTLVRVTGEGPGESGWGVTPADRWIRLDNAKTSHDESSSEPVVFRRLSVSVGNGSGISASTSGELFASSPRERLQAEGDRAPVLEVVDTKAANAAAAAGHATRDTAKVEAIARIADELLGDVDRIKLPDLWKSMGERMLAAKIGTATTRGSVTDNIVNALGGAGIIFERGGQAVRLKVAKIHTHATAPWWVVRVPAVPGEARADA